MDTKGKDTIYKIIYNNNNKIQKYIVFSGTLFIDEPHDIIREQFLSNPTNEKFTNIFDKEEINNIITNDIPVIFSQYTIFMDDTIETIKYKLLLTLKDEELDLQLSYNEIYLYYQEQNQIDATEVYQGLTKNGTISLTKERFIQFLLNIENINITTLEVKEEYIYEDILALQLDKEKRIISKPFGQRISAVENDYPYIVNPFNVTEYSDFLERYGEELVTTTNKSILMSEKTIYKNSIFLCDARDVYLYAEDNKLSSEITSKLYYPFLFRQSIITQADLIGGRQELLDKTHSMITDEVQDNIERVELFYNIFNTRTKELAYTDIGIRSISLEVHPQYTLHVPLDIIFKILHATERNPLIKYNPGRRQEKIYRLYANQISTNGKKIPFLTKSAIIKIIKMIGSERGVHIYIEYDTNIVICSFYKNGVIHMQSKFNKALSINSVNEILLSSTEQILSVVKEYFVQSGYKIAEFSGIDKDNINIINMEYTAHIKITKNIKLRTIYPCLSNIFSVINDNINEGIVMRLKRVSNYNDMDSQEAYIIEKLNSGSRELEIIQGLNENFGLTELQARQKLADFVSSMQVVQDAFQKTKFKVKANPGFLTTITKEQFSNQVTIIVSGITNINYLKTIPIYIDTLLRLSEEPNTTKISPEKIQLLCKRTSTQLLQTDTQDRDLDDEDDLDEDEQDDKVYDEGEIVAPLEIVGDDSLQDMAKDLGITVSDITAPTKISTEAPNMLDMLMASDEDDTSDDEDEEDNYDGGGKILYDIVGGDGTESDEDTLEQDITGMSISNPNPFFKRMQDRDPVLFLKESEGKFNAYSRACPWNVRRQPVMLTDKEKEKIDREHPGSYHEAIKYGSNPEKQYWYICPRYWSLKKNTSLTEEEAKSGKYGTIIPTGAKKVPPGGGVLEFTSKIHNDEEGNYIQHYPGFLKQESHPNGLCLPCCFKTWDSPVQIKRRKACTKSVGMERPKLVRKKSNVTENYIMGSDKFPLEETRYGYLPLVIQHFLNTDNTLCQISKINTALKKNHPCILRHGIETSKMQSFIGCIADIWVETTVDIRLTIKEMKEVLIAAMSLDIFITLQNGDLIDIFAKKSTNIKQDYSEELYSGSKLYKTIDFTNKKQKIMFYRIVTSYENFIDYLRNDEIKIDYTYLWDLICKPNINLFKSGSNLIILEIPEDDVTDNVNVICPTNHYSKEVFNMNRDTIILIKKQNYYEPIYLFEDKGDEFSVMRRFNTTIRTRIPEVIKTLQLIKYSMNNKCSPKKSMPKIYHFKQNIILEEMLKILSQHDFTIITQIMNLSGRIIGVVARDKKTKLAGVIPCYPSSPVLDIDYSLDESPYVLSYSDTLIFLRIVNEITKGEIPCRPSIKMIEDNLIVGLLTETNQFIIVTPEEDRYGEDMPKVEDYNYNTIDNIALTSDAVDNERINFIKMIELERNFYSIFRNTVRILLGEYKNILIREKIEKLAYDTEADYKKRLTEVVDLLINLTTNDIRFVEYKSDILEDLHEITNCTIKNCQDKSYCFSEGDEKCALLIPNNNLIHGGNNEEMYYGRLADEIIRYTRIKSFMFKPQVFLTFKNIGYNLRDDEIILLQSLLLEEYFEDLVLQPKNPFISFNTYDTASPLQTQIYSHTDDLQNYIKYYEKHHQEQSSKKQVFACLPPKKANLTGIWAKVFPRNSKELVFNTDPAQCSFDIILILIKYHNPRYNKFTIYNLLEILALEYSELGVDKYNKILQIWKSQGKTALVKRIQRKETTIEHIIVGDMYYATNIDIWLLARRFKLPLVFYSSKNLIESGKTFFVANSDDSKSFYFIKSPAITIKAVPKYRLAVSGLGSAKIPLDDLSMPMRKNIEQDISKNTLENFISSFDIKDMEKYKPKKLILKKS